VAKRTIVCLANSRKLAGRCIAGRVIEDGGIREWLRPVSARQHQEVSRSERLYANGREPQLLDIIEVPLIEPCPEGYQQENWLLSGQRWARVGSFQGDRVAELVDGAGPLWLNGWSTYNGCNDQIPLENAAELRSSLRFVRADGVRLHIFRPSAAFGNDKRRVQAQFEFENDRYGLWVTDPAIEDEFLSREDGWYDLGERYLTISLGEPFREHCHKLVAAVLEV